VRVEEEQDLDAIVEIEAASFTSPWTREMYVSELFNRSISHIYVLRETPARIVGFCAFWLVFDEVHINNLAVLPETRGRGYGTALLRFVIDQGRRLGARRATLEVRRSNEAAQRLYTRLGFRVAGTRVAYYSNPAEDALILWRDRLDSPP
jgi:ribosomal-protein-alanine N-acetyltransferase